MTFGGCGALILVDDFLPEQRKASAESFLFKMKVRKKAKPISGFPEFEAARLPENYEWGRGDAQTRSSGGRKFLFGCQRNIWVSERALSAAENDVVVVSFHRVG